jgi:hypothetical protein
MICANTEISSDIIVEPLIVSCSDGFMFFIVIGA